MPGTGVHGGTSTEDRARGGAGTRDRAGAGMTIREGDGGAGAGSEEVVDGLPSSCVAPGLT